MTPADLARNETHAYPGKTKHQVFRATAVALKTLGYDVVVSNEATGHIKTAPQLITVVAYGSPGSAVAAGNSLAWNIHVKSEGKDATVHAEPRGYSAGQAVDPSQMNSAFLERSFRTLYGEIESDLSDAS